MSNDVIEIDDLGEDYYAHLREKAAWLQWTPEEYLLWLIEADLIGFKR
jgi:hypothetical protein